MYAQNRWSKQVYYVIKKDKTGLVTLQRSDGTEFIITVGDYRFNYKEETDEDYRDNYEQS